MDFIAQQPLVLLADTDALLVMDLSDALEQAGYRVLRPAATILEALATLERERPTLAILDVALHDGVCTALSRELRRRGIPFLVHSSMLPDDPLALGFQDAPWLTKPALPEDVVAALDELAFLPPATTHSEASATVRSVELVRSRGNPLIRKLEGFVALLDADRAILERISANPRLFGPRVDLIQEGDTTDGVFLVLEGMACRHKTRENGARQITAYLLPGISAISMWRC